MDTNQNEKGTDCADMEPALEKFGREHGKFNMQVQAVVQSLDALKEAYGSMTAEEAEKMTAGAKIIYSPTKD